MYVFKAQEQQSISINIMTLKLLQVFLHDLLTIFNSSILEVYGICVVFIPCYILAIFHNSAQFGVATIQVPICKGLHN